MAMRLLPIAALLAVTVAALPACRTEPVRSAESSPGQRDPSRLFCGEHGVYEDECVICHPEIAERAGAEDHGGARELFCSEHRVPERECGICQPALADMLRPGEGLKIRLASAESAGKAGVVAAAATGGSGRESIPAPGELAFNGNRLVRVTPLVDGVVGAIHVDVGAQVRRGDPLVELTSSAVAEADAALRGARAALREAEARYERESSLHAQGVSSAQEVEEARARRDTALGAREAAAERLRELGLGEAGLDGDAGADAARATLILRAPFDGTVTERRAVPGDVAKAGEPLLTLCDLGTLWLNLAVSDAVAARVGIGTPVTITTRGSDPRDGTITWIASELEPATRRVRVRAEIPNPDHALRAGAFVEAEIHLGAVEGAFSLDRSAVHRFGGRPFVFVELEPDLYEVRRVELGPGIGDGVLVTAGLAAGDRVVVGQSYLLKSEFQKSRLGAGCVD